MTGSLKERMRFFKLRTVHNAYAISTTFNKQFQPEIIPEQNDALQIDWIDRTSTEDVLVGDTVCIIFSCHLSTRVVSLAAKQGASYWKS